MSGSFVGLNIARSGLYASQKALDVVGKNIANANTVGYTRQRTVLNPSPYDLGVEVVNVEQVRDQFLDNQYRSEANSFSEWEAKTEALTTMEDTLQEPSDHGLNQAISDFFSSMSQMAKQPESKEMRTQVRQNALNLTDTLHYVYNKFTELQQSQDQAIATSVDQVNTYAENIANLNYQILRMESDPSGQKANELRDQRNTMIDQLSQFVKVNIAEQKDGSVTITMGDHVLVDHQDSSRLKAEANQPNKVTGEPDVNSIVWEDSGEAADITGGKIKSYIDIRDGAGISDTNNPKALGIPYFINKLNVFAKAIAKTVNDVHATGYTVPNESNGNTSQTGIYFFNPTDEINQVTAKNITLSDDIMNNVYNIASADTTISTSNQGNNNVIKQLAAIQNSTNITITIGTESYNFGSFEGYAKEITSELAIESSHSTKMKESEDALLSSVESRRSGMHGVSIDEEMTNMIQFQHTYSAAAKVISTINQNLDTLINRMG